MKQGREPERHHRASWRSGDRTRLARNTALAVAAAISAALLTKGFFGFFEENLFLLFLVAVLGSNLLGGWLPGAAASITSVLVLAYGIFQPRGSFAVAAGDDVARLAIFALVTAVIGGLSHSLLVARERARSREKRLRESEETYRGLFDNTVDAVYLLDPEGVVIEANPAATRLFGYERDELVGMTPDTLASEEQRVRDVDLDRVERAYGGEVQRFEWEGRTREGKPLPVEISLTRTPYFGRDAVMAVARDLTEQREMEQRLHQAQRMEAVGRLAGGVAHDFNNVLTIIGGHAALALDRVEPGNPLIEDLEEIQKGSEFAASLTRQLLAFSRQQLVRPQIVDLGEVVAGLDRMLKRLLPEDVELEAELDATAGAVRMDPGHLEQVVMNLVVNARDALPGGGRISLSTRRIPGAPGQERISLVVADDGVGMDESTRSRVFEPFFTTKAIGKGTGLGLSTVYGIVKQAGGMIEIRSAPGAGTQVEVQLPRREPASRAAPAEDESPRASRSETVLVVEDEKAVRELVRKVLTHKGYSVLTAEHGRRALEVWDQQMDAIDLVLTDIVMPEMGGPEAVQRMHRDRPGLAVLYTSGYTENDAIARGLAAGSVRLLQKPFTPSVLLLEVRRALDDARDRARRQVDEQTGPRPG